MPLRKALILIPLILIGGFLLMRWLMGMKQEPEKKTPPPVERYVKVRRVTYQEATTSLTAYGRVASVRPLTLVAEVGGRLLQGDIPMRDAQGFAAGQLLYRIDDTEARLALQAQKSDLLNALGGLLPDLKLDYVQAFPTWEAYYAQVRTDAPLPPLPDFKTTQEKTFFNNRRIPSLYYGILSAEERLTRYRYTAPFAGSYTKVDLQPGSVVTPGARLASVIQTDQMEAVIPIAADQMPWVQTGAALTLFAQDKNQTWTGVVRRVSDQLDPATNAVNIYVAIAPGPRLYEGLFLQAQLPGKTVQSAMELTRKALFNGDEVFIVENGKLKKATVQVHKLNTETFLFSGLEPGAQVAAEALANVTEGMTVTPTE